MSYFLSIVILSIFFIVVSGASEAVMDKLQFHFHKSIFSGSKYKQEFWDPSKSWVNKYKSVDTLEPKFLGSTTYFVFLTDAWHLFKFFKNTSIFIALSLAFLISPNFNYDIVFALIYFILGRALYGMSFSLTFYIILNANKK